MNLKRKRDATLLVSESVLREVCFGRPSLLSFEKSYRAIYIPALFGLADDLVKLFVKSCWRLALSRDDDKETLSRLRMVADVCRYLTKFTPHTPREMAARIARHPSRHAVRKLFHVFRWGGVVLRCRQAFDEVRFRPGGSGYAASEARFSLFT